MNTEALNRWLTLGANFGVLVGIGLLVVELNQNRDMMEAQTRHQIAVEAAGFMQETANNSEIADIIVKALNGQELTQAEAIRYRYRVYAWLRRAENNHYQYCHGLFDEDEFAAMKRSWEEYVNRLPAIAVEWCDFRDNVSPAFREELDPLFDSKPC